MKDSLKWTKSKIFLIALNCVLCISIVVSAMMIVIDKSRIKNGAFYSDGSDTTVSADGSATDTAATPSGTARLVIAGENTVYRTLYTQAQTENGYNFSKAYAGIKSLVSSADLAIITQSTVMDDENEPSSAPNYNSPNEMLNCLIDTGFDAFNQANDHITDMDISGVINDLALFKATESATLFGLFENRAEMMKPVVKEINGIKISFVGITESLGGFDIPDSTDIGILDLSDTRSSDDELEGTMRQLVSGSKEVSDIVCVTVHWDGDYETELSDRQNEIIDKLLSYGADIIVGTGTDTAITPEYKMNGDHEDALVIPSLGRIISLEDTADSLLGGIADITVTKNPQTGVTTVTSAKMIPTVTVYSEDYANLRVMPFSQCTEATFTEHGFYSEEEGFTYNYASEYFKKLFGNML